MFYCNLSKSKAKPKNRVIESLKTDISCKKELYNEVRSYESCKYCVIGYLRIDLCCKKVEYWCSVKVKVKTKESSDMIPKNCYKL